MSFFGYFWVTISYPWLFGECPHYVVSLVGEVGWSDIEVSETRVSVEFGFLGDREYAIGVSDDLVSSSRGRFMLVSDAKRESPKLWMVDIFVLAEPSREKM